MGATDLCLDCSSAVNQPSAKCPLVQASIKPAPSTETAGDQHRTSTHLDSLQSFGRRFDGLPPPGAVSNRCWKGLSGCCVLRAATSKYRLQLWLDLKHTVPGDKRMRDSSALWQPPTQIRPAARCGSTDSVHLALSRRAPTALS